MMHHFSERIFFNEGNNFKRGLRRKDLYIYSSSCFVIMVGILMVLLNKMYAYPILCVRVHVYDCVIVHRNHHHHVYFTKLVSTSRNPSQPY